MGYVHMECLFNCKLSYFRYYLKRKGLLIALSCFICVRRRYCSPHFPKTTISAKKNRNSK